MNMTPEELHDERVRRSKLILSDILAFMGDNRDDYTWIAAVTKFINEPTSQDISDADLQGWELIAGLMAYEKLRKEGEPE